MEYFCFSKKPWDIITDMISLEKWEPNELFQEREDAECQHVPLVRLYVSSGLTLTHI